MKKLVFALMAVAAMCVACQESSAPVNFNYRGLAFTVIAVAKAMSAETAKKEKRNARFLPFLLRQANAYAACSDLAAKAMFDDREYDFIPNFLPSRG